MIEDFLKNIKNHDLVILKDEGLYRHIKLSADNTTNQYFEIVTFPGYLIYVGDMGSYTFARQPDMFNFFRADPKQKLVPSPNYSYWSEKCIAEDTRAGIRKFDIESFRGCVIEDTLEWFGVNAKEELSKEVLEEISPLLTPEDEWEAIAAIRDFRSDLIRFDAFYEHTLSRETVRYQWCCCAIQWAIRKYDEEKASETRK